MSSDTQFTARGEAVVGFQTNGARIERGADVAGTEVGLAARGPVAVRARGAYVGVEAVGGSIGIEATGGSSYGAIFKSARKRAQVLLMPHSLDRSDGALLQPATPNEVHGVALPRGGVAGDLLMTVFDYVSTRPDPEAVRDTRKVALWICVGNNEWREVLLGHPVPGTVPAI